MKYGDIMIRTAEKELVFWKDQINRLPLLIRGARQVGKSYLVENFAKSYFQDTVIVNFDFEPKFKDCFTSKDPFKITQEIELLTGKKIIPQKVLLFLDEIQECPMAIKSLRYFKEKYPQLHVIAAGSLLEFTLNSDEISMPVGRVRSIYLRPLSFEEYLLAKDRNDLLDYLSNINFMKDKISESVHHLLLELIREYFIIGGMPQVIDAYLKEKSYLQALKFQEDILEFYKRDFYKYPKKINTQLAAKIFSKAFLFVGRRFRFSELDPDVQARDQKPVLEALSLANVITKVFHSSAGQSPLEVGINDRYFKLLFLDIGLNAKASKISVEHFLGSNAPILNQGMLCEQFVGQELQAYHFRPYFWQREKKGSQAEIDFLIEHHGKIYPIEVKSGTTGRLMSLQVFKEEKKIPLGIRISAKPLEWNKEKGILSIPFYLIWKLESILQRLSIEII